MSDVVIQVENLGKRYSIRHQRDGGGYQTFRDALTEKAKSLFRRNGNPRADSSRFALRPSQSSELTSGLGALSSESSRGTHEDFWALRNVSFEVERGEVLGIIGRNGAGKTTLLKILSRITEPTEGRVRIKGRVASLLEVGTGFHPELTGRENIYLNGAILGMSKAEIKKKFDEIVAFAETEKFLDTPVKRYSSGMYVRLAFAVAAHLEPEILVVDEVLAVGDAEFQKKCLGKMQDVSTKEGRTVLFVSHNMVAVAQLCSSALLLQAGRLLVRDNTTLVVDQYVSSGQMRAAEAVWKFEDAPGNNVTRLSAVRATTESGEISGDFDVTDPVTLTIEFWILRRTRMTVSAHIYNRQGINLFALANFHDPILGRIQYEPGLYSCSCTIPANYLNEGDHLVKLYLTRDDNASIIDVEYPEAIVFTMRDAGTRRGEFSGTWLGVVRPVLPWRGSRLGSAPQLT
jgi:lipopolysaccharide transport system ATP-binding protein